MADGNNKQEDVNPVEALGDDFIVIDNDGKAEDEENQKFVPRLDDGETEIDESFDSRDEDEIPHKKEVDGDDENDDQDGDGDSDGDEDDQHEQDEGSAEEGDAESVPDDDEDEDAGDGDADDADDDDDEDVEEDVKSQKKKKQSAQDRIKQAVKRQRKAERRAQAAEDRAQAAEDAVKNKLTPDDDDGNDNKEDKDADVDAPDPSEFTYGEIDPKYIVALAKHETSKVLAADERKREKVNSDAAAAQAQEEWKENYEEKIDMGKNAYDDFDEVVLQGAEDLKYDLTPETAQMAVASPVGHHIMYHLATNPKLAKKVAQMSVIEQAQQFGRLAARFEKTNSPKPKTPNNKPKAPAPLKRRRGGKGVKQFDPETASFEDLEKHANKILYPGK